MPMVGQLSMPIDTLPGGNGPMGKTTDKNIAASIKNRLLAVTRQIGKSFETRLTQYSL
jgi:hypothetical protein